MSTFMFNYQLEPMEDIMARKSLAQLMTIIDEGYEFTPEAYPEITDGNEFLFGINHSTLHMLKSLGLMAAEVEKADHGGQMDDAQLALLTLKQLVNVLKLACHLGISVPDIERHIVSQYGKV